MQNNLPLVIRAIEDKYRERIRPDSPVYLESNIGKEGERLGFPDVYERFRDVAAIIPIDSHVEGMKVMIDGRTFVKYAQLDSGIAMPEYVAKEAGAPYHLYKPDESMILNF